MHERGGSVFWCPPGRSALTAASLGMRGRGDARGSRALAVSWRPATWHPRLDMGRLSRPRSSTSHRNLPVRVGVQKPRGPDKLQPLLDGFQTFYLHPNFMGRRWGEGVWHNVSSFKQGMGKPFGRERKFPKQKCRQMRRKGVRARAQSALDTGVRRFFLLPASGYDCPLHLTNCFCIIISLLFS